MLLRPFCSREPDVHSRKSPKITDQRSREHSANHVILCAVQRHGLSVGANPTRQLSLQPVAIGAVAEVTKRLKPSV